MTNLQRAMYHMSDRYSSRNIAFNAQGLGVIDIPVSGTSAYETSEIGRYWNGVRQYLNGYDTYGYTISEFEGRQVAGYFFETDLSVIGVQAQAGDHDMTNIYE